MEPVPETEKMEGFKAASPHSNMKQKDSSSNIPQNYDSSLEKSLTPHRTMKSNIPQLRSPLLGTPTALNLHSEYSPSSQERQRSLSQRNGPPPPPIFRTQSMPGYCSINHGQSSPVPQIVSPRSSSHRVRYPRKLVDEPFVGFPLSPSRGFPETPNPGSEEDESKPTTFDGNGLSTTKNCSSLSRSRRPISPHLILQQTALNKTIPSHSSISFSPSSYSSRLSDQYISNADYCHSGSLSFPGSFSSYSIPSTPTSARSRSSSISSLETIPDSPDAEEAALEADRIARSKLDADTPESCDETKIRFSRDVTSSRGRILGSGFGRDKRKRWSVCGAERRGDLNLDTIWED